MQVNLLYILYHMDLPKNTESLVITEKITSGWVETTYIGTAIDKSPNNDSLTTLKADAIWSITKFVKTTSGGTESVEQFQACEEFPAASGNYYRSSEFVFVRNDRASLTYL